MSKSATTVHEKLMAIAGIAWLSCLAWHAPAIGAELPVRLRRPVALVLAEDDTRLYVANRTGGSISTIDVATGSVTDEVDVGRALADLVMTPDGRFLLAVDEAADELIAIERRGDALTVVARQTVANAPVSVRLSSDGSQCFVTSLWGRAVTVLDLDNLLREPPAKGLALPVLKVAALPFSPRSQCLVAAGTRLVVADAFGGELAVIDTATLDLVSIRQLTGHNIRGLALSSDGRQLLVAHQILNSNTETSQRNVFWGAVMTNVVRTLPVEELIVATNEPLPAAGTQVIGGLGNGAGDPAAAAVNRAGDIVVALAGVREIAIRRGGQFGWLREATGRRPTAIALSDDGRWAYVANTFGDSIAVVDIEECRRDRTIALGPRPELSTAERGETLFYDARLSYDGWFSCHSCHTDGHTNGLTADNFGDGSAGAAKRVLSLLGTADTGPWAWDGHVERLEDQVRNSLGATMRARNITEENVAAIAAYLRGLPAPPPAADAAGERPELVARGRGVFERTGCIQCHQPATYTSAGAYDVGLPDELGRDRFNPPSLRGVRLRGALFHDNRAASLDDVVNRFGHGSDGDLSAEDATALLAFLRSL